MWTGAFLLILALNASAQSNITQNNLIQNGGFDSGGTSWSNSANGTYFYNQTVGSETDSIISIGWTNGSSFWQNTGMTFLPGVDYVLSIRANVGSSPLTGVQLLLQDVTVGSTTLTNQSFNFPDQTQTWRIFSLYISSNTVAGKGGDVIGVKGSIVENPTSQQGWLWMDWIQLAPALPYFSSQPVGVTNNPGSSVSLSAAVIGAVTNTTGPGSVILNQWYQNGNPLLNATNPTLTFSALNNTNGGSYYVMATAPYGTTRSTTVTVALVPGFVLNNSTPQAGVVVGTGTGNDTVMANGAFTGSYAQNPGNIYSADTINILSGANISSPNNQPFITNNITTFTGTNGLTFTNIWYHQSIISFIHGSFTNNGVLSYNNNALAPSTALDVYDIFPAGSAPNPNTNRYVYHGEGVFDNIGNVQYGGPVTIVNGSPSNTNAAINSVIMGSGQEIAEAVHAEARYSNNSRTPNISFLNYGSVLGCSTNCINGSASGYNGYTLYGGQTVYNGPFATATALAPYDTTALYAFTYYGDVNITQAGTATAISTGGLTGNTAGLATAVGVDLYTYNGQINLTNTGIITAIARATNTANANAVFAWSENGDTNVPGGFTFVNTGTIIAISTNSPNAACSALYGGCDGGIVNLINTGTVIGNTTGGGWGWGTENDRAEKIYIYNSGSISHNTGLGVFVYGQPGGNAFITNMATGSIYGGNEGIATENFSGNVTIYDYGSVMGGSPNNNAMDLGPGNDTVHLYGLPNIVGWMNGQGGSNVLDFELTGVLQLVNGSPATLGDNLSAYSLGTSGNITVSGQTYKWANFKVTGAITSTGGVGPVVKAATNTDLTAGVSWTGGIPPIAGNIACWMNNSLGSALTMNSAISWGGINVAGAQTDLGISGGSGGVLTLGGSGISLSGVNTSIGNNIALAASQTWTINSPETLTSAGIISSNYSLTKAGGGTLMLSGQSTFSGGILISGGLLSLRDSASIRSFTSDATDALIGTTSPYGSSGYTHALAFNQGGNVTINGLIFQDTGTATSGTGWSVSNWNNHGASGNFPGGFPVASGQNTYNLLNHFYYGNGNQAQTLTISGLAPGQRYNARIYYRDWNITGDIRGGTWTFNPGTGVQTTIYADEDADNSAHFIDYFYIAGLSGTLTMSITTLNANNSWHLYGFSNQEIPNNILPANTPVNLTTAGAALDLGATPQSIGSLTGVANTSVTNLGSLTMGTDGTSTGFGGVITGSGTVIKAGAGTLLLSGANTYSGGTSLNGGTLNLANVSALGVSGSTLYINAATTSELSTDAGFGGANPLYNVTLNQIGPYVGTMILNRATPGASTPITHNFGALTLSLNWGAPTGLNVLAGPNAPTGGAVDTLAYSSLNFGNWYGVTETIAPTNANVVIAGPATAVVSQAGSTQVATLALDGTSLGNQITGAISDNPSGTVTNKAAILKSNSGKWTLSGTNIYTGNTTISAGTLALVGNGSIAKTPNITIAGGATLDVSGLSSPFILSSTQTLNNSSAMAMIKGNVSTGTGTLALNFASGTPALVVTNGVLTLSSSTVFQINNSGSQLAVGSYTLISPSSGGVVAGAVMTNTVSVGGSGVAAPATLAMANGQLNLVVGNPVNTTPTNFVASMSGRQLTLQWPADHTGWTLKSNSISLANPNNWFAVPGSTTTNKVIITINPAQANVFYRMTYP